MSTEPALVSESSPVVAATTSGAIVPIQQHEAFYRLPERERERVQVLLRVCGSISESPLGTVAAIRMHAPGLGMSYSTLRGLFYAYKKTKDWRVFVRQWGGSAATPTEFQTEVKRRMELNGRSMMQAIQSIKDDFRSGKEIPGYGTWQTWYRAEFPAHDLPAALPYGLWPRGWSKTQLYLKAPSKAERALKTRGWLAAKRYLPHVVRDMSGLRFLELIVIDDFETDIMVLARNPQSGRYEIVTCKGLLAIDGATRTILAWALKPKFGKTAQEQAESGGAERHGLTQADVKGLIHSIFSGHGLPADYGVTILCENATAAIGGDFEVALESMFGVQVARTGLMAKELKTLRNGFAQSGGKPYEKGWIESTFNLAWNLAATLPGQKGATYQLKPADHAAKLLFAQKLVSIEGLTDAQIAELRVDFLREEEALNAFTTIFDAMDRRTNHHCQGFEEVVLFRLPDGSDVLTREALALRQLPADQLGQCEPVVRMESPLERKARVTRGVRFVRVAEHALALLLLTPKRCTLANHKISFEHAGKGFTFFDAASPVHTLPEGTELLGYFDGVTCGALYVTRLDGSYVGEIKRRGAVDIRDTVAIGERAADVSRLIMTHVLQPQRARHEGENAQLAADNAHNLAVLRSAGVAENDIPARLLPAPERPEKPAHAITVERAAPKAKPATLSAKLARTAPARDAFTAHREALARGIAEGVVAADERADRADQAKAIDPATLCARRASAAQNPHTAPADAVDWA